MSEKFKVGDKVKCTRTGSGAENAEIGDVGKIIYIADDMRLCCLVEFEAERSCYHNGNGRGKPNHCYFCSENMLELVDEERKFKFEIGDKVIGNEKANKYGVTIKGWTGSVVKIDEPRERICVNENSRRKDGFWVEADCFDLVESKKKSPDIKDKADKIIITVNGTETTAQFYKGGKVVKTATAKCSSSDEFNFETGAKLAFDRMMKRKEKEEAPHLEVGDTHYGVMGTPTKYKDVLGKELFVGDTVNLFDEKGNYVDETPIVETKNDGQFVMGVAVDCNQVEGTTGRWQMLKKQSYSDVADCAVIGLVQYIK